MQNKNIIFVAYGGGHVAMLVPVYKALVNTGHSAIFLGLTTAAEYLETHGIPYIGYRDLPGAGDADVIAYGRKLAKDLLAGGRVSADETIAYLGLNFREMVRDYGEDKAVALYAEKGRQAFLPIKLFERWLSSLGPAAVIASNSPRSEQAALLAAGRLGIPSVCIVDVFGFQEIKWIGSPNYADRVCVLNENVRQMFVEYGRKAEQVIVTGNPAFDEIHRADKRLAGKNYRKMRGWGDDEIVVLWASQVEPKVHPFSNCKGDPDLPRRIEAVLRKFVAENDGFRLIVRYHPSEQVEFKAGQDRVDFSQSNENLAVLLHAVDLTVVTASTVGLQAHIAGKKVISVDKSIITEDVPYSKMGISVGVNNFNDLEKELLRAYDEIKLRKQRVQTFCVNSVDNATENIFRVVKSILPCFDKF